MGLMLAVAGAILLFVIIITGYRLMASQGDPEKIKAAREQLTGAIAGIVFIVFSIAILAFIGVNVLHIPGFK
jgi:Mn2+/Fe2+ NRAMP family transporter